MNKGTNKRTDKQKDENYIRLSINAGDITINFLAPNFFMQLVQCVCIVYAKYQMVSLKAVVRVAWPVYALFKQKHNPCLKQAGKNG